MPQHSAPRNLRDLLRAEPRLDPPRVERLLAQMAAGLAGWHAAGRAHGALTPERVLLDAAGDATLAEPPADDGGLAPWPAYLAPEQLDGRPADARSDVYTLGLLGWEMLAGQSPWAGESLYRVVMLQREHDLPRLSTLRPGLPRPLVVAIEGALHKHPGDRWRDAGELASQLDAGAPTAAVPTAAIARPVEPEPTRATTGARGTTGAHERAAPAPAARASRLRARALATLVVAVLGAGVAGLVAVQGSEERGTTKAWLDSIGGGAAGEVVAESTLLAASEREQDEARRAELARRARAAAQARRDSIARAVAESTQAATVAPPVDSAVVDSAPPDSAPVPVRPTVPLPPPESTPPTPSPVPPPLPLLPGSPAPPPR